MSYRWAAADELEYDERPPKEGEQPRRAADLTTAVDLKQSRARLWRYPPHSTGRRHRSSTSTPTSRPWASAHATSPELCAMLNRSEVSGAAISGRPCAFSTNRNSPGATPARPDNRCRAISRPSRNSHRSDR